ncbi:MAG: LptF/LptG family permease [Bacteroidales bacterium]|nr:LptF/LptG family permease [Bacteroidales bacterium]
MFRIKRIYTYMLQSFLPLFFMTLAICVFIFMMQFLWRYVDDLVGKGLSFGVLAELFGYASLSMFPLALPLSILLASLMTFGNMGDKLELLSMKASGISLLRIMRPLLIFISLLALGAFFFQNDLLPWSNVKLSQLMVSIRHKSPEMEIPKGVFYKIDTGGDTYNIYVQDKNVKTGILYDVTIYFFSGSNVEDATVTVADSARLQGAQDGMHMKLSLWNGEQLGTFKEKKQRRSKDKHRQYRRESFVEKEVYIPFNSKLEMADESNFSNRYNGKKLNELVASVDSLDMRIDSINCVYGAQLQRTYFKSVDEVKRNDSTFFAQVASGERKPVSLDSIYASLQPHQMVQVMTEAQNRSKAVVRSFDVRKEMQAIEYKNRSLHEIEIHKKFVLSFACIIFFLIGAPLGAIIRKGGLGIPVIVSVIFFIIYFVIDNYGVDQAKTYKWPSWQGVWFSSMVLAPVGIFLTWRAINDSTLFDWDAYKIGFVRVVRRASTFLKNRGIIGRDTLLRLRYLVSHREKTTQDGSEPES